MNWKDDETAAYIAELVFGFIKCCLIAVTLYALIAPQWYIARHLEDIKFKLQMHFGPGPDQKEGKYAC